MMGENREQKHLFDVGLATGVLVYSIDNQEAVHLHFDNSLKVKVLFTSFDASVTNDAKLGVLTESILLHNKAPEIDTEVCDDLDSTASDHAENIDGSNLKDEEDIRIRDSSVKSQDRGNQDRHCSQIDNIRGETDGQERILRKRHCVKEGEKSRVIRTRPIRKVSVRSPKLSEPLKTHDSRVLGENEVASDCSIKDAKSSFAKSKHSKKLPCSVELKQKMTIKRHMKQTKDAVKKKRMSNEKHVIKRKKEKKSENLEEDHSDEDVDLKTKVKERPRKLLVEKAIQCEYCEKQFKNQQEYYDHRRAEESRYTCGMCGKVEPYEAHLIVHMQKHRRVKVDQSGPAVNKSSNSESEDKGKSSQSSKQGKNKKERMKCNVCGLVVSSIDSLKIHTMLHTGECAYRCCVCGEKFSSLSSRQHHMDTHVSKERFRCNPCGKRFVSRAELAKHQLTHEIKCALCGETFPNKTSRTCHFRVSHPNDILKCSLCANMFATQEDLNKHLIYHKKGKKEQCPVCGLVVSKLKDHMLLHSQHPMEKMYVCDQCPMRYLRKSNLDRHMRTHTGEKPYACDRCPKSFRSNGMLRKHLLTHTQERPYQCEVCGKRCSLRSNLTIHMRVHNSDRHFPCTECPQAFNHKNSLHAHIRNKHSRETSMRDTARHLVGQNIEASGQDTARHLVGQNIEATGSGNIHQPSLPLLPPSHPPLPQQHHYLPEVQLQQQHHHHHQQQQQQQQHLHHHQQHLAVSQLHHQQPSMLHELELSKAMTFDSSGGKELDHLGMSDSQHDLGNDLDMQMSYTNLQQASLPSTIMMDADRLVGLNLDSQPDHSHGY